MSSLLSLEQFCNRYGDFVPFSRDNEPDKWHKYFMDITAAMNKHIHTCDIEDGDDYNEDLRVVFVDHWKKNKFGWLIIKNVSDLPYRIRYIAGKNVLECDIPHGDKDGTDTEIMVHFLHL
jgi:hypothetical protein